MRYELYEKIIDKEHDVYFYIVESNSLEIILTYMENFPQDRYSKYVIIDNNTPYPVNYFQLGLNQPPSPKQHYNIIYECKLAIEYYNRIKVEEYYDDNFLNYEEINTISNTILEVTNFNTERYFDTYNSKIK